MTQYDEPTAGGLQRFIPLLSKLGRQNCVPCITAATVFLSPAIGADPQEGVGAFQEAGAGSKGGKLVLADLKGAKKPMLCLVLFLQHITTLEFAILGGLTSPCIA